MSEEQDESPSNPDIHFEPIMKLPLVETKTLEEEEEELVKLRARLFRYDDSEEQAEWKERGTGDVKILKHRTNGTVRVVMRRDKTLKICANHYVVPSMELKPNCFSEKAWIWSTLADYTDEEPKPELLAIRFANAENALKFKDAFEEAKKYALELEKNQENKSPTKKDAGSKDDQESEDVLEKLKDLNVGDDSDRVQGKTTKDSTVEEAAENGSTTPEEAKPSCKTKTEECGS